MLVLAFLILIQVYAKCIINWIQPFRKLCWRKYSSFIRTKILFLVQSFTGIWHDNLKISTLLLVRDYKFVFSFEKMKHQSIENAVWSERKCSLTWPERNLTNCIIFIYYFKQNHIKKNKLLKCVHKSNGAQHSSACINRRNKHQPSYFSEM